MALFMTSITPEILKTLDARINLGSLRNDPSLMGNGNFKGIAKWLYEKQSFVRLVSNAKIRTGATTKLYSSKDIASMTSDQLQEIYKQSDELNVKKNGLFVESGEAVKYEYDTNFRKQWVLTGGTIYNQITESALSDKREGFSQLYSNVRNLPFPGITDVTVANKNAFGSVREATIKFVCHCIEHLEILELLYMTPGIFCYLEWGWSLLPNGEWNLEQMSTDDMTRFDSCVIADVMKRVKNTGGHYDAMKGVISNFNWSMNDKGGFECTTTLVSQADLFLTTDSKSSSRGMKGKPIEIDAEGKSTVGEKSIPRSNINWLIEQLMILAQAGNSSTFGTEFLGELLSQSKGMINIKDNTITLYNIPVAFFTKVNQSNAIMSTIKHWMDDEDVEMYVFWSFIEDFLLTNMLGYIKDQADECGIVNNELIMKSINGTFPSGSGPITDDDVYETTQYSNGTPTEIINSSLVTGANKCPEVFKPIFPKFNSYATKIFNTNMLASGDPLICLLPGQTDFKTAHLGFGGPNEGTILSAQEQASLQNNFNPTQTQQSSWIRPNDNITENTPVNTNPNQSQPGAINIFDPNDPTGENSFNNLIQSELNKNNEQFAPSETTNQLTPTQQNVNSLGGDKYLSSIFLPVDMPKFAANIDMTKGYVRNIAVNVNFLKKVYDDTDSIDAFVMGLLNGISDACGEAWKFGLFVDEDNSSVISVVDLNEWKENDPETPTIPCYGTNSICREVSLNTEVDAKIKGSIMFGTNQKRNAKDVSTKGTQGYQFFGRIVKDITVDNIRQSDISGFPGDDSPDNKVDMSPEGLQQALEEAMTELYTKRTQETSDAAKTAINNYLVHVIKQGHEPTNKQEINGVVLPLKLNFTIDGLAGLKYGNVIKVEPLPQRYDDVVHFTITNIEHNLSGNDWTTHIETVMRVKIDPSFKEIQAPDLITPQGATGPRSTQGSQVWKNQKYVEGKTSEIVGQFIRPASGTIISKMTPFRKLKNEQGRAHYGVDISTSLGTPIYASADGIVTLIDNWNPSAGNYIEIIHTIKGKRYITRYMHMMEPSPLKVNDRVLKGKTIVGYVGNTGHSFGSHLHFEIRGDNGLVYDPQKVITDLT